MTEKQEALKPCPFCGGEARQGKLGGYPYSFFVQCSSLACTCGVSNFGAPEKAAQYWNTRALTEAPKVDGWQPIETAPKDGTEIFLSLWSGHPSRKTSFCWATSGFYKNGNWYSRDPMTGRLVPPSHWMKINPPCEEGDAQ